jgi:transcriptional regulator with XRE-family HTH domain
MLQRLRVARGMSQSAVAARAGVDRSYVNRLEAGERGVPAPSALEALAAALDLAEPEADQLFAAAGLLPRSLRALGAADPTLLLLARRLTDPGISTESRAALRTAVEALARHWADPAPAQTAPPLPPLPTPPTTSQRGGQ